MMTNGLLVISAPSFAQSEVDKAKGKQTPEELSIQYQKDKKPPTRYKDAKTATPTPTNEGSPAVETQYYNHSVQSPKGELIREQNKATDKAIHDTDAAKPIKDERPAATAKERGSERGVQGLET